MFAFAPCLPRHFSELVSVEQRLLVKCAQSEFGWHRARSPSTSSVLPEESEATVVPAPPGRPGRHGVSHITPYTTCASKLRLRWTNLFWLPLSQRPLKAFQDLAHPATLWMNRMAEWMAGHLPIHSSVRVVCILQSGLRLCELEGAPALYHRLRSSGRCQGHFI